MSFQINISIDDAGLFHGKPYGYWFSGGANFKYLDVTGNSPETNKLFTYFCKSL